MRVTALCLLAMIASTPVLAHPTAQQANVERYFEKLKQHPNTLTAFIARLPKGGDLHNHLAGATYTENLLKAAENDPVCIAPPMYQAVYTNQCAPENTIKAVLNDPDKLNAVKDAWSMHHFNFIKGNGHDHFFATFGKYTALVQKHKGAVLAEILTRAAKQNENYLELMITADNDASGVLGASLPWTGDMFAFEKTLKNHGLNDIIAKVPSTMQSMEADAQKRLACATQPTAKACQIKVRYLYQVLREQKPGAVFAQFLTGFELAKRHDKFVGLDIVMPEDGKISLRDYDLQMRMLNFLHKQYPFVNISLHAGELNKTVASKKDRSFHIREAINVGHAKRIGHGDDVLDETNANALLKEMANKQIMVEINLTSNEDILGIEGKQHPFPVYLKHRVPVALSTDDAGVLRTDLNKEYLTAVTTFDLDYPTLKQLDRNSLTYSFLPGKSLWINNHVDSACRQDVVGTDKPSRACRRLLSKSEKARLQWQLEKQLTAFEKSIAG